MKTKKLISIILAVSVLVISCAALTSCKSEPQGPGKVTGNLKAAFEAVSAADSFVGKISEVVYKDDDADEMIHWSAYSVVDIEAASHLTDYAISLPTDYCNTYAVFVFDDGLSDAGYDELIATVTKEYVQTRASSLQMYMPDEYAKMSWALEHQDLIWRRYDNALALIITGDKEASEAFKAFEASAVEK